MIRQGLFHQLLNASFILPLLVVPAILIAPIQTGIALEYTFVWTLSREFNRAVWGCLSTAIGVLIVAIWWSAFDFVAGANQEEAYSLVAANGNKVVAALESFHQVHGTYPASLDELVPVHIDEIPDPGILACNRFVYELYDSEDGHDEPYRLIIPINILPMDFDHLFYQVDQKYGPYTPDYDGWGYLDD